MVAILLSSPVQPQCDTKVTPDRKATLMTGFFLYINLHNEIYFTYSMCTE